MVSGTSGLRPAVRLAVAQMRYRGSIDAMMRAATERVEEACHGGAEIICLQEMYRTDYFCQSEDHRRFADAEPIDGPSQSHFAELAKRLGIVIVVPIFERRAAGVYHNTVMVLDVDGSLAGIYRKMHIPDDPLFYEKFYFTPGDLGFRVIETSKARLGVGICWDQWFPEAARLFAIAGAEILVYPTAIGWIDAERAEYGVAQHDAWRTMMRSHAIANGLYVAAPNRVGTEGPVTFWGGSFICGPDGQLMCEADQESEGVWSAEISMESIDVIRTHWPFLRDRRIDAYEGLTRRMLD